MSTKTTAGGARIDSGQRSALQAYRRARRRALLAGGRLPGGFYPDLDLAERRNRRAILDHVEAVGPVFTATAWGDVWVCVVGTERSRRLLAAHRSSLTPYTFDISELVPGGFMRQMAGEMHATYRGRLVSALRAIDVSAWDAAVVQALHAAIDRHSASPGAAQPEALTSMLATITTDFLAAYVLGAPASGAYHEAIADGYRMLGERGNAWTIGDAQRHGYAHLVDAVHAARAAGDVAAPSLLHVIDTEGGLDETMLGNLIYMVELGRFDLRTFIRWLLWFAVHEPDEAERVRTAAQPVDAARQFVYEALRLEQSERLARSVDRSFRFEGKVIPKGAMLRLCMWESHKDGDVFADPFTFDTARMQADAADTRRHFSPFGLDQHVCPFESVSVRFASLILAGTLTNFRLAALGDGPALRGGYHFEPSPRFTVGFTRR